MHVTILHPKQTLNIWRGDTTGTMLHFDVWKYKRSVKCNTFGAHAPLETDSGIINRTGANGQVPTSRPECIARGRQARGTYKCEWFTATYHAYTSDKPCKHPIRLFRQNAVPNDIVTYGTRWNVINHTGIIVVVPWNWLRLTPAASKRRMPTCCHT